MKFRSLILGLMVLLNMFAAEAAERRSTHVGWLTSYSEGVKLSQASGKPMVVLFTGSDWCTWCIKLEEEALNTPEFAEVAADRFIFVKLDFPLNKPLPADATSQNKQLQRQFNVSGFPTIVVLDSKQQQVGTVGYRPGGGRQYALNLLKMVDDQAVNQRQLNQGQQHLMSGTELKKLYEQALEHNRYTEAQEIALLGLDSSERTFFLLERYRFLAEKEEMDAAKEMKKLLLENTTDQKAIAYEIALIEFQLACKDCGQKHFKNKTSMLENYIAQYQEDKENIWKLQMLIAQVYLDNKKTDLAYESMLTACECAPQCMQAELSAATSRLIQ